MTMKLANLILALLLFLSGCASLPARLLPAGGNATFAYEATPPYSAYIAHCRELILAARTDLDSPNREAILAANLPFELRPDPTTFPPGGEGRYRQGIILIHGLSDSPSLVKELGEYFRSRGFLVRAILLPGAGTRPGDLTTVRREEWQRAVGYAVAVTTPQVEQLYLGGFSLGGALAVAHALEHPDTLGGLFLFSPCLRVKDRAARWAWAVSLFRNWLGIRDDRDYAKYESFAINGIAQTEALTDRIDRLLCRHPEALARLPVFTALSWEDLTADSARSLELFQRYLTSPTSRLLLYSSEATLAPPADPRITLINSLLPDQRILSLSHLAVTVPPTDPHYGSRGDYRNCLHYPAPSTEFAACSAGRAAWFGEKSPANLTRGLLQRLTWNPFYDRQCAELDRFLAALASPR